MIAANDDSYLLDVTSKVFEWLRWAATLGALRYVQLKSGSDTLALIVGFCTLLLGVYYSVFFRRLMKDHFTTLQRSKSQSLLSILMATILAVGTFQLVNGAITETAAAQSTGNACKAVT